MRNEIKAVVSKKRLKLIPDIAIDGFDRSDDKDNQFKVLVTNESDRFASFQVELEAIGIEGKVEAEWYQVDPELCAKKPPGDETEFDVVIIQPPFPVYQTTIDLKVKVFSVEYADLYTEQRISLTIEKPRRSLKVYLPIKDFQVFPGDLVKIPVLIYNLSPKSIEIILNLSGLESYWFEGNTRQEIQIAPGDSREEHFLCQPPRDVQIISQAYEFAIETTSKGGYTPPIERGTLTILPYGVVKLNCPEEKLTIPTKKKNFFAPSYNRATYELEFTNKSNLVQEIDLEISEEDRKKCALELPEPIEIEPGQKDSNYLVARRRRPWLGREKRLFFKLIPILSSKIDAEEEVDAEKEELNTKVRCDPSVQNLELRVKPIVPFPLQILGGLLGLILLWLLWYLFPPNHKGPVNSVRIIGNAGTVISGSSDRTIRRWQINSGKWYFFTRRLNYEGEIASDTKQPVRVIRQSTRDDDVIAAGLDNGDINIWNILSEKQTSMYRSNDRVFDLDFTKDARYLFSAHGSGFIYKWNLLPDNSEPKRRVYLKNIALYAIAISDIGENQPILVLVGGRYGRFGVWEWKGEKFYDIKYKINTDAGFDKLFGQNHYINSLAISREKQLLAMADNRGYITLWNLNKMRQCINDFTGTAKRKTDSKNIGDDGIITSKKIIECDSAVVDQWQENNKSQPVHSIAITKRGCYLASVGDDEKIVLWPLEKEGERSPSAKEGKVIAKSSDVLLKTVDIKAIDDKLLIANNAKNYRVNIYRTKRMDVNAECYQ